jgi:sigma54-dependent transcription regulator
VRVIAASNKVPEEAVKGGHLREDLFHRLNAFHIHLPIVVTGNPDLVDTLGVERHPSRHSSFYFNGHSGSSAGLLSHSGRSSD